MTPEKHPFHASSYNHSMDISKEVGGNNIKAQVMASSVIGRRQIMQSPIGF